MGIVTSNECAGMSLHHEVFVHVWPQRGWIVMFVQSHWTFVYGFIIRQRCLAY